MLAMAMAVVTVIVFLNVTDFGFVGTLFVTPVRDPVVRVHIGEKRRADAARGKLFAGWARHGL